jgi:hypothetical protein
LRIRLDCPVIHSQWLQFPGFSRRQNEGRPFLPIGAVPSDRRRHNDACHGNPTYYDERVADAELKPSGHALIIGLAASDWQASGAVPEKWAGI